MYSRKKRRRTTLIGEARADFAGVTLFLVFVLVFAPISRGVRAFPPILQRFARYLRLRAVFAPSRRAPRASRETSLPRRGAHPSTPAVPVSSRATWRSSGIWRVWSERSGQQRAPRFACTSIAGRHAVSGWSCADKSGAAFLAHERPPAARSVRAASPQQASSSNGNKSMLPGAASLLPAIDVADVADVAGVACVASSERPAREGRCFTGVHDDSTVGRHRRRFVLDALAR